MNTAQNLDREFAMDLEEKLGGTFRPRNVVSIRSKQCRNEHDPQGDADRLEAANRQAIPKRQKRISDTKKGLKATLASIAAARKAEKIRHDDALAEFSEREAEAKAQAQRDIDADQRIVASCKAALEALTAA